MFVPEFSNLQDNTQRYYFSYSIRMSLLPEGCSINGMTFDSCQLLSRHWVIRAYDVVVANVNGEAVIGKVRFHHVIYVFCVILPKYFRFDNPTHFLYSISKIS